ncbi:MAG: hypothetical protein U0228_27865 [Myxococcaceae bacterium]
MEAKTLALIGVLALILVGALLFARSDAEPARAEEITRPNPPLVGVPTRAVPMDVMPRPVEASDSGVGSVAVTSGDGGREAGELDSEVDPEHLRALGLTEADVEPLDAGVLHPATAEGVKAALATDVMAMRACLGVMQSKSRPRIELTLREIPGRARSKIGAVEVIGDAGVAELDQERCLLEVVKGARFDVPRGGESRVTFAVPPPRQ